MNLKEVSLEEMELHESLLTEGLSALMHTILFLRAPNLVKPEDHICDRLAPIVYAKCGPSDVDATVNEAIEGLQASLTSVGPFLSKGIILLSFFEKREMKGFFGLVSRYENVYFERWRIPVLVNERSIYKDDRYDNFHENNGDRNNYIKKNQKDFEDREVADSERKYFFDSAIDVVQKRLLTILEAVNNSTDHVPPTMYEYEIETTGPLGERREQSIVTRLINSNQMNSMS